MQATLEESEFNQRADETLEAIEEALDNSDADLDWDLVGGILTIVCGDEARNPHSQVIINRQSPTRQIWVAARSGGYHLDYDATENNWQQGELELFALLSQALSEQIGESITLTPAT